VTAAWQVCQQAGAAIRSPRLALAGAIAGAEAFPAAMLDRVCASNKDMHGFDLELTIEKGTEKFC